MAREWGLGTGDWERVFLTNAPCPTPHAQCPKNCAAIRSEGQSHISHDLDKLDSISLQ